MKYSEPIIIILYLIIVLVSGHVILRKARNRTESLMGAAALVLGCGDAFHLVPRLLNNLLDADFTAALGIGKFITSVTMTVFYVLLYYVWRVQGGRRPGRGAAGIGVRMGRGAAHSGDCVGGGCGAYRVVPVSAKWLE